MGVKPDMTILLDLPVETGLNRARTRNDQSEGAAESRMDDEETAFHQRVRDGYLELSSSEPERFLVLDAVLPPDSLEDLVMEELRSRFPDVF